MKGLLLAWTLALGCSTDTLPQKTSASPTSGGSAGASGSANSSRGGESPNAGHGGASGGGGAAGDPVPPPPDNYDDSGCEHPKVEADCTDGWCKIPPGCFIMGSPDNEWSHSPQERRVKVTLTRAFEIGEHEVTQAEWTALALPNPSRVIDTGPALGLGDCADDNCPVGNVTWFEAVSYANLLSDKQGLGRCYELTGCVNEIGDEAAGLACAAFSIAKETIYDCEGFRLPTDPEWEYAARAGTRSAYYSGDLTTGAESDACVREPALDKIAWYCDNAGLLTHPVGTLEPNAWGLFDVIGNAAEWAHDQGGWLPVTERLTDPDQSYGPGAARDVRGGAHFGWPSVCRVALRLGFPGDGRAPGRGFRVARTLP